MGLMPLVHGAESSSHIGEEELTTGPDQKGTAAAAASPDQQVTSYRCFLSHPHHASQLLTALQSIATQQCERLYDY